MDRKNKDPEGRPGAIGPEEYQRMDEKEKDAAIMRSIIRLQSRIHKILYLTEKEKALKEEHGEQGKDREEDSES